MLQRKTRNEIFKSDGTSSVETIEVHLPSHYVTFDDNGRTCRVQEVTQREVDGNKYRHQVQVIEYDEDSDVYGAVETIGVSLGDLWHVLGSSARDAFPGLSD